jgi:hypothetical protein
MLTDTKKEEKMNTYRKLQNSVFLFGMHTTMLVAALALVLGLMGQAHAFQIYADTTGPDNFDTAEFYGIQFLSGSAGEYIKSITYDVSVDTDAFFDFNGDASYGDQHQPVLGTLIGITAADISWDMLDPVGGNPLHPARLRFNFAAGSFGVGDSMRFAADTDYLVNDPAPGSVFGQAGVPISVTMFSGVSGSANFVVVNSIKSEATIIPEPATIMLLGLGAFVLRRKQ